MNAQNIRRRHDDVKVGRAIVLLVCLLATLGVIAYTVLKANGAVP